MAQLIILLSILFCLISLSLLGLWLSVSLLVLLLILRWFFCSLIFDFFSFCELYQFIFFLFFCYLFYGLLWFNLLKKEDFLKIMEKTICLSPLGETSSIHSWFSSAFCLCSFEERIFFFILRSYVPWGTSP